MKKAILTTKVGMTQIFNEDGVLTPVTVLQAGPCVVTQVKTVENDGYAAVQVGYGDIREKLVNKPMKGHFAKAGVAPKRFVREFGSATTPGRVFKGKKMPGHMGAVRVTVQNLEVVRVDAEQNLILVNGAVPGPKKSLVMIKESTKA